MPYPRGALAGVGRGSNETAASEAAVFWFIP